MALVKLNQHFVDPNHVTAIAEDGQGSVVHLSGGSAIHVQGQKPDQVLAIIGVSESSLPAAKLRTKPKRD